MSTFCQNEAKFIAIIKSGEYGSLKSFGGNALHNAAYYGYVEACNKLIDLGFDVNEPDGSGHSVFSIAAKCGHYDACKLLIARGANVHGGGQDAQTELSKVLNFNPGFSTISSCSKIAILLIESGCDINKSNPLSSAAKEGLLEVCKLLIKYGANVDAGYKSPLMEASGRSEVDICKLLILNGASVMLKDYSGPLRQDNNAPSLRG